MKPEEALANLDNVAANFQGTRQQHVILQQSTQMLAQLIEAAKNANGKASDQGKGETNE